MLSRSRTRSYVIESKFGFSDHRSGREAYMKLISTGLKIDPSNVRVRLDGINVCFDCWLDEISIASRFPQFTFPPNDEVSVLIEGEVLGVSQVCFPR